MKRIAFMPHDVSGNWKAGMFRFAMCPERLEHGLLYRGLALTHLWSGSPKGRRPPAWTLTHIGSGHILCNFEAHDPYPDATRMAECGEWDWEGLEGWRNVDPEIKVKALRVLDLMGNRWISSSGRSSESAARQIAMQRA